MGQLKLFLVLYLLFVSNSFAESKKEKAARESQEEAILERDFDYKKLKQATIESAQKIYGTNGLIQERHLAKEQNPCVKQAIQFSDIPSGEAVNRYIDELRGKIKPGSASMPSGFVNSKCPGDLANLLELDKKIDKAVTKLYIDQFKLYLQKYKVLSHVKSDQDAYMELYKSMQSALDSKAIQDLNPQAKNEIQAKAREFLDQAKNSSTDAGLNTCTSESCAMGPLKGLNALIEKLEKIQ